MVTTVDIVAASNTDFRREFAVSDRYGLARRDLNLSRLYLQVRKTGQSNIMLINLSTDPNIGGLQLLAPVEAGRFVMTVPWRKLNQIGAGAYVHDLIEVTPLLIRRPLWRGTFTIAQGITR